MFIIMAHLMKAITTSIWLYPSGKDYSSNLTFVGKVVAFLKLISLFRNFEFEGWRDERCNLVLQEWETWMIKLIKEAR